MFGCRFRFFLSYNHHLPPCCASPPKNPPIFVPHPSYAWNGDLAYQPGLQDLLEEKDGSDVDAEAAALMLELRGEKKKYLEEWQVFFGNL